MAGINFIGSYSGIDQTSIDKLMEAHKMPLKSLNNKKTSITDKQNAWKDVNTRLNNLFEKLKTLQKDSTFLSRTATSTNDKMVTMEVGTAAPEGEYKIAVKQLATNTRIIGKEVKENIGAGSFIINSGVMLTDEELQTEYEKKYPVNDKDGNPILGEDGEPIVYNKSFDDYKKEYIATRTIDVEEGASLQSIAKQINAKSKDIGVKATVIDGKLVLEDNKTGDRTITLENTVGDVLGDIGIAGVNQETGKQAIFTINGVTIERDSNRVSDAIEGVTINLHKAHTDDVNDYDVITVGLDTEKATAAIEDFVKQYNSTMQFMEDQLKAGDPDVSGSRGKLAGDGALMRIHATLSTMVTNSLKDVPEGGMKDISEIGVSTVDRYGKLQFNSTKLVDMLKENPQRVMDFFKGTEKLDGEGNKIENGYSATLNKQIDSYISTKKDEHGRTGIIKSTMESFERTIKDLNEQIERFNERMDRKEQRYIKMFTALDVAMMKAEGQMQWLQGQVDAMNGVKR